ncbi:MAG: sugar phosphate isomerase/epimerase family protein [Methanocellales archaeon]
MKFSFSSLSLTQDPFEWAFELEKIGFKGWEIVSEGKQKLSENLANIEAIASSTNLEITVHAPFSDLNIASLNQLIWEVSVKEICNCIKQASSFASTIVIHPGVLSPLGAQLPDKAWEQNIAALKIFGEKAREYGVRVVLENMPNIDRMLGQRLEELLGLIENSDQNIGIALDVGHAYLTKTLKSFLSNSEKIAHVHLHDNLGKKDDHLPIGTGAIKWQELLPKLMKIDAKFIIESRNIADGKKSLENLRNLKKG